MRAQANPSRGSFARETATEEELYCSPMSSGQLQVWFVEQLAKGIAVNNLFFGVHLDGDLNLEVLDLSLKVVVDRHEAFRTTFDTLDGEPVQLIGRARLPTIALIDLSGRPPSDLAHEAYTVARREVNDLFDLTRGPLVRLVLLRLAPQNHIMLAILHHIICDGWSLGLFAMSLPRVTQPFATVQAPR